MKLIIFGFT